MVRNLVLQRLLVTSCMVIAMAFAGISPVHASGDTVDEIKYSFGDSNDSVVFDWHGAETQLYYGLDTNYGKQVTASHPSIMPTHGDGNYQEAVLSGLSTDTTYHYKIGTSGLDHTFQTVPTGNFRWVDIGDSMSTSCGTDGSWMTGQQQLIADQQPNFVTHGGDIAVPNQCGLASLHQYFMDQQVWSTGAAFQMALGNHEYGAPTKNAPSTAITDNNSNYKGRVFVTHAQTADNDTPKTLKHPGCGAESGSTTNTCLGEDWGWFQAGRVLFISYPEPEKNLAWVDWQNKADVLMSQAQADPNIDFIVTWGHRPAYTSSTEGPNLNIQSATQALAAKYSPTASNPDGKYVINVQHHAHSLEAFNPINGLTYINDAGGGQGLTNWVSPFDANSAYRMMHFGIMSGSYDASSHSLSVKLLCGADYKTTSKGQCMYGTTLWSQTFTRPNVAPQPVLKLTYDDSVTAVQSGQQVTYTATVTNDGTATSSGGNLTAQLPQQASFVSASDGAVPDSSGAVSWSLGYVGQGQTVTKQLVVTYGTLAAGDSVVSSASITGASACDNLPSQCAASDQDDVASAITATEYVTNPSLEQDTTGWITYNTSTTLSRSTTVAWDGIASLQTARSSGSGIAGFTAKPRLVTNTTANAIYKGNLWVKASVAGMSINFQLREVDGTGTTVGQSKVTVTLSDTAWHQIAVDYTAVGNGTLIYNVFGSNLGASDAFWADSLSLTSAN